MKLLLLVIRNIQLLVLKVPNDLWKLNNFRNYEKPTYLKQQGVTLCGIEIVPEAQSITTHPFRGSTCFMAGNEGEGLTELQKSLCDHFVYIPQYGNGTASLNVSTATAIVLHHFSWWAGYTEQKRENNRDKYEVHVPHYTAENPDPKGVIKRQERLHAKANEEGNLLDEPNAEHSLHWDNNDDEEFEDNDEANE